MSSGFGSGCRTPIPYTLTIGCCAPQFKGKGYWGKEEGIERLYNLPNASSAFVQNPYNYERVQAVLSAAPAAEGALLKETFKWHNRGFSGACFRAFCLAY